MHLKNGQATALTHAQVPSLIREHLLHSDNPQGPSRLLDWDPMSNRTQQPIDTIEDWLLVDGPHLS